VNAAKLIRGYGSVEEMCKLHAIDQKHHAWALEAKQILTLLVDVPVPQILPAECRAPWRRR
jgi:hypothetical protein